MHMQLLQCYNINTKMKDCPLLLFKRFQNTGTLPPHYCTFLSHAKDIKVELQIKEIEQTQNTKHKIQNTTYKIQNTKYKAKYEIQSRCHGGGTIPHSYCHHIPQP